LAKDQDGDAKQFLQDAFWDRRNNDGHPQKDDKDTLDIIPITGLFVQDDF